MAKTRKRPEAEADQSVDMSPMIDLVFLLLIFFIVNANLITVEMDKSVEVPSASNSVQVEDANGRIVINISEDGTVKNDGGQLLESSSAIQDYVENQKLLVDSLGYAPKLHLRGDRRAIFKHSRKVIRAAANAGVEDVHFAAFLKSPGW